MKESGSNHVAFPENAGKQTAEIALSNARLFAERMANECHTNGQYTMAYALLHILSYLDTAYKCIVPTNTTSN